MQPFIYAYNWKADQSSNATASSLKHSWHGPGPKAIDSPSSLPTDDYKATSAQVLRIQFHEKFETIKSIVSATLQAQQIRYRQRFVVKIRSLPYIQLGQLIYVNRPSLPAPAHYRKTSQTYNTLVLNTKDLHFITSMSSLALSIDENRIPNYGSVDKAALILVLTNLTTLNCKKAPTSYNDSAMKEYITENTQQSSPMKNKYVADDIVQCKTTPKVTHYRN